MYDWVCEWSAKGNNCFYNLKKNMCVDNINSFYFPCNILKKKIKKKSEFNLCIM